MAESDLSGSAQTRRLTTVLAADVVGYSRLMAADEAGTVARFNRIQREIFAPAADRHGGRIVKLMGDGVLMEFPSVVGAVEFAAKVQEAVAAANAGHASGQAMVFRIGINIGDVIAEGDDIFGSGVNVAARLESLAEPGGICVSGTVVEHVRGKVDLGFESLGQQAVKNIPDPVDVYRVVSGPSGQVALALPGQARRASRWRLVAAGLVAAVLAVGGLALWRGLGGDAEDIAAAERMAFPLPDRPSIAVLPFRDLTEGGSEAIFADGITEDLITDLSKVSGLFVIARNSSFLFKDEDVAIGTIAERLGVRYVLEGSVRRAGEALRVNAQLIDTTTGVHVWAERFDGDMSDLFSVQDTIAMTTVDALRLKLTDTEMSEMTRTDTNELDAKAAFQTGWALYSRFNEEDNARAVPHFEAAIRLDPEYGRAYGALALVYLRGSAFGWDKALGVQEATLRHTLAPKYLREAERYGTPLVHVVRAMQHLFYRHTDEPMGARAGTDDARREAAAAIALQPNDPEAHVAMGWALIAAGRPVEGLNSVTAAQRLNPNYPSHYVFFEAAAHFALDDLDRAAAVLREGLVRDPGATELAPMAASVFAATGQREDAERMVAIWQPGATAEEVDFAISHYRFPITWVAEHGHLNTRLIDGLRLAALPAEETVATLLDDLGAGETDARVQTIRKLGWFGAAAAPSVPALTEALSDTGRRVRREAAITLGKIGSAAKPAIPDLRALIGEPIIGFHAENAIAAIEGSR